MLEEKCLSHWSMDKYIIKIVHPCYLFIVLRKLKKKTRKESINRKVMGAQQNSSVNHLQDTVTT